MHQGFAGIGQGLPLSFKRPEGHCHYGSAGKTTTKDIIASLVGRKYRTRKTRGNLNNHYGLPLTLLDFDEEEVAVLEMGMSQLGEISCWQI